MEERQESRALLGPLGMRWPAEEVWRAGGEMIRPAECEVGGHRGAQLEDSSRQLVLGLGLERTGLGPETMGVSS